MYSNIKYSLTSSVLICWRVNASGMESSSSREEMSVWTPADKVLTAPNFMGIMVYYTVCPRRLDPIYVVTIYIKWVRTSWTPYLQKIRDSVVKNFILQRICHNLQQISVADPFHFDTAPYPGIRLVEKRIRIRPKIEKFLPYSISFFFWLPKKVFISI